MPHQPAKSGLPGALLLRDALRIVRHVAREGRDVVRQSTSETPLPVSHLANAAIAQVDRLAHGAEDFAHLLLGDNGTVRLPVSALQRGTLNGVAFAHAAYATFRHILPKLGAENFLISEFKTSRAFESVRAADEIENAARLIIALKSHGAIAELRMIHQSSLPAAETAQIAHFGLMLWMLTDQTHDETQETLDVVTALSLALKDDILSAQDDPIAIAALLSEFRHHV